MVYTHILEVDVPEMVWRFNSSRVKFELLTSVQIQNSKVDG